MDKDLTGGGWEAKAGKRRKDAGRKSDIGRMKLGRTLERSRIEIGWKADEGRKEVGRKVIFIYVKIISYFCMNYGHRSREL